jgi:hypothetical protein
MLLQNRNNPEAVLGVKNCITTSDTGGGRASCSLSFSTRLFSNTLSVQKGHSLFPSMGGRCAWFVTARSLSGMLEVMLLRYVSFVSIGFEQSGASKFCQLVTHVQAGWVWSTDISTLSRNWGVLNCKVEVSPG